MTGTNYANLAPEAGDVENSYEKILDIYDSPIADLLPGGTPVDANWLNVPEISGLDPKWTPTVNTISNYAYKGRPGSAKSGDTFEMTVVITKRRNPITGDWYPEYKLLRSKADADGDANKIGFRFYDALGATEAYQGIALVGTPARQETGDTGLGSEQFTLTGDGKVGAITNPITPTPAP